MKISVVLTTYNGEKHIIEQLKSILWQTRQPDEVIIADDCSVDKTYKLIKLFIEINQLKNKWILYKNEKNIGFVLNFKQAIKHATGDIIFLSDQDDVWFPNKISLMSQIMIEHTEVKYLETQRQYFTGDNTNLKNRDSKYALDKQLIKIKVDEAIRCPLGTSMKLAVTRDFLDSCYPKLINSEIWIDHGLCVLAAARGKAFIYNEITANYRVHLGNASNPCRTLKDRRKSAVHRIAIREKESFQMMEYRKLLIGLVSDENLFLLQKASEMIMKRSVCLKQGDILTAISLLFVNNKFINRKVVVMDIYCMLTALNI